MNNPALWFEGWFVAITKIVHCFRCYCKGCKNPIEKNPPREIKTRKKKSKGPSSSGELKRMKDTDFYRNLGLKVIEPRWSLEESLLLWILLERKVLASDIIPSNVGRLQKEFNFLTNVIQEFNDCYNVVQSL